MKATFKVIPNGVLNIPEKLTSVIQENYKMIINMFYDGEKIELYKSGLNMKKIQLWSICEKMYISGRKIRNKIEKERGEGNITIFLYHIITTMAE